ncbi:acetyl-CoA carboxylase, carboxyltransferase subunit beta [Gemmatimonadota bacterium]
MGWFKKVRRTLGSGEKLDVPKGLWTKCDQCGEIIYRKELEAQFHICSKCGFHFRIGIDEYLEILTDGGFMEEFDSKIRSKDPLGFVDSKKYTDRLKAAQTKTGMMEAVRTGLVEIDGRQVVLAVLDFAFLGGSMGSAVGEKIARATQQATEMRLPLVIISASGGARMQEGILSLMQLAKTSARLAQLREAGLLFISVLTHPTTGGVTASFSMLGDVIVAEPGALIGFAGPRVIMETIGQELPEGFQRSEFLLEKGFVDIIALRSELKQTLTTLFNHLLNESETVPGPDTA